MVKVLVVGQTPPPYGGQAIMIQKIIEGRYNEVELFHVRLAFSKDMEEVGHFKIRKIFHLLQVILSIIYMRIRHNVKVLYYPPAGPNMIPMYRDLVILISTRWMFEHIIFHFHAGGLTKLYPKLNPVLRFLFRWAYLEPDGAIVLSELNPPDAEHLKAKRVFMIPYGLEDNFISDDVKEKELPSILYVGTLRESKGILVLIDALAELHRRKVPFRAELMGRFSSARFRDRVVDRMDRHKIASSVKFLGVLSGDDKWQAFAAADVFCFPTFFESETFGLVVLEAMQFALPVVATRWRGVPSLVRDGETGYLVPPRDSTVLADKLAELLLNPEQAENMGQRGREAYLQHYTIEKFRNRLEEAFLSIVD
jgi:glycosyltransferase involved in cell wall biosynthesis